MNKYIDFCTEDGLKVSRNVCNFI